MVTATTARRPVLDPRVIAIVAPIVVAAIVVINGRSGVMPGVGFWDTGEFQTVLPILGTAHPTGYPTYVLLGFLASILLAPIGEPAFRINVLSLLAVAVAAGASVALVRRLTGSTIIGVAVGLGLATTPLVWTYAMGADPHPIHLAFVALLLLALVTWEHTRADRWLVASAVVFGLAAGKSHTGRALGNPVLSAEAKVTVVDGALAAGILAGLVLNAAVGWWWADIAAGAILVVYGLREGLAHVRQAT